MCNERQAALPGVLIFTRFMVIVYLFVPAQVADIKPASNLPTLVGHAAHICALVDLGKWASCMKF